jgi:hypothetical protein
MTSTFRGIGVQEYPNSLRERVDLRQLDLGPEEHRRRSLTALGPERHQEKSQFECVSPPLLAAHNPCLLNCHSLRSNSALTQPCR